jgi:outer membrane protein OmpA-like peptidoglycan-associated protein
MIRKIILSFLCISLLIPSSNKAHSFYKSRCSNTDPHFIVVIGAFAIHKNALRFAKLAHDQNYEANFEFNPDRNLYYVFTLTTTDREAALKEAKRLREETTYTDAWVYQGNMGESDTTASQDINPVTEQPMTQVPVAVDEPPTVVAQPVTETKPEPVHDGKKFFFKLYRANDNKVVKGEVNVVDVDRSRKMGSYKTNESIYLPSPKSTSGKVLLVTDAFGYRKTQREINYNSQDGEDITTTETEGTVIPFELIRLRKGDIVVMYNVYFFKDAAVMSPESRYEVDNLLEMLEENPKCRIRIHGHTNGNGAGKIISMGDSKNFFSLDGTKEGIGSAKALSEARAQIIRDYLVDKGIDQNRLEIKAWGGKRALYDKESVKAKENVRVEIEILED